MFQQENSKSAIEWVSIAFTTSAVVPIIYTLRIGECDICKKGGISIMFCGNKKGALGLEEADGSFAEYVIADSMFTVPIPENVSFADTVWIHTKAIDIRPH
jgi:D-arabinose 1-dehydrogenase-like Zn-dependent alcohol dehydrogenase